MSNHRFDNAAAVFQFVTGGNALFTIESVQTGTRFTYSVRSSEDNEQAKQSGRGVFFVSLLSGPNNETDFAYLGILPKSDPATFRLTAKSRASEDAPSVKAFRWFWRQVCASRLPASVACWHEGRCGRCGRTLTVPSSIETGFGPECADKMGL